MVSKAAGRGFCEIEHCGRLVCSSLLIYGACMIVRLGIILEYSTCADIFFWKSARYCAQEKFTFDL